ncbi:hypothetical protein C8J56DRAFT_789721 [Mycena floridula]|nr:hypothetical protein C8J56DRAFT_789721 [Mycena floridula]
MSHECHACDEPAERACSACKKVWYCSKRCQEELWNVHIFDCNPPRPLNSADYLARDCLKDRFPERDDVKADYGFNNAIIPMYASNLLGLYQGLILYHRVKPFQIHKWRRRGELVQNIRAVYEAIPQQNRGDYYPWFLEHQWLLDLGDSSGKHSEESAEMVSNRALVNEGLVKAWRFTGGATADTVQDIKAALAKWPAERQMCHSLYLFSLAHLRPNPGGRQWVAFGWCAMHESEETQVSQLWLALINKCTFDQFCTAYKASAFIELLDSNGLRPQRLALPHHADFEDVLRKFPRKSVWYLKDFVLSDQQEPIPSIPMDYGFRNCRNEDEKRELKDIYAKILRPLGAAPLKLHAAAIQGKLFEHVGGLVELNPKFKCLMENVYPLSD